MFAESVVKWWSKRPSNAIALGPMGMPPAFQPGDFSPPLSTRLLILQPTPFCNIDCDYCYLPDRQSKARMSLQTVRQSAQRLVDDGLLGPDLTVVWHAGEPLTVPPAWYGQAFAEIDAVLGRRCEVSHAIQTNAMLIDDAWCELFKQHQVRIGVSVDGPADLHDAHRKTRDGKGTHAKVLQGMAKLRQHGIAFHAIAVVTPATFSQVSRFIEFFEAQGVTELGCNFDEAEGGHAASNLDGHEAAHLSFLEALLKHTRTPGTSLRVRELVSALQLVAQPLPTYTWRGHTWPANLQVLPFAMVNVAHDGAFCTFSPELLGQQAPRHQNFVFGHVGQSSYLGAAENDAFQTAWAEIVQGLFMCQAQCAHFAHCGGGAPANKFYENGRLDSTATLYCRTVLKRPFEVALAQLERDTPTDAQKTIARIISA